MIKEKLISEIRNAFADEIYPGDSNIVYNNSGSHLECEEVKESFKGKTWQSLPDSFLFEQRYSLSFFSHEGFKYYLPAFLIFVSNDFYNADDLSDNLVLKLTLPTEMDVAVLANAVKKHKIDEQMPDINFDEILRNQLHYINQEVHNFIARVSQFSQEQGLAIKHYLEFMQDEFKEEFSRNEPALALERYWFQFE